VPAEVLSVWRALSPPRRECVLATVLDRAVTARAAALQRFYDPAGLTSVLAAVADQMLDEAAAPFRAGPFRAAPFRAGAGLGYPAAALAARARAAESARRPGIRPDDIAPPPDFGRAARLARHPGPGPAQRAGAAPAVHGLAAQPAPGQPGAPWRGRAAGLDADLAIAALGVHTAARLPHAARLMGADAHGSGPGWLEVVLSWPDRIIRPARNTDLRAAATR
jgi:uncharacterized protein